MDKSYGMGGIIQSLIRNIDEDTVLILMLVLVILKEKGNNIIVLALLYILT